MSRQTKILLSLLFLAGLLIRIALIPNPGFEADISFWKSWGLGVIDKGFVEGIRATNNNYPLPFSYTLGAMVWVYKLFADPHNFNAFWSNTNLLFLTICKSPSILADIGIVGIILFIGKKAKQFAFPSLSAFSFQLSALLFFLNPVVIMDGAWWGQVDSVGIFIFLLSFVALLMKKPTLAGLIYILAVMTKLQNMIYAPLYVLFIYQYMEFEGMKKSLIGALVGFVGLNIEFFRVHDIARIISSLTDNANIFPWMSLNAYNIWWIVAHGKGMAMSDKYLMLGLLNAKTIGLILFSLSYLFVILRQIFHKITSNLEDHNIRHFLENLILVNASFFFLMTESHDRYAVPLTVFLLLWGVFYIYPQETIPEIKDQRSKIRDTYQKRLFVFTFCYLIFNFLYSYNLHTALVINYPNNGLPIISAMTTPLFTISASVLLLSLFGLFVIYLIKKTLPLISFTTLIFLLLSLFLPNLPLLQKKSIPITKLSPISQSQDFGYLMQNLAVGSTFGINKWTRLSTQYAFYKTGLGTHANSSITYHINKTFSRFTSDYGIDTEAGSQGSVIFEVWGDDKRLFGSEVVKRFDLPRHIDVPLSGISLLTLNVKGTDDGITDDHADWLNTKLWP
ncbi:NPCBM/NEW2 domain-containing protein [Candidatus Gottesmanbacteria bacterium]|nr:NPCBM/NEW2 domain-containing protein [Candidatus Gottesmanbacteria bacterium]